MVDVKPLSWALYSLSNLDASILVLRIIIPIFLSISDMRVLTDTNGRIKPFKVLPYVSLFSILPLAIFLNSSGPASAICDGGRSSSNSGAAFFSSCSFLASKSSTILRSFGDNESYPLVLILFFISSVFAILFHSFCAASSPAIASSSNPDSSSSSPNASLYTR